MDKKANERSTYIEKLRQAANALRQEKQNYLPIIYQALASKDKEAVKYAAYEIAKYMSGLDSTHMIQLDEHFRQYSSME